MATRDKYDIAGDSLEQLEGSVNFAMRGIADRLDQIEHVRGHLFIEQEVKRFTRNDTRPSVKDHHLFTTKNVQATTITHLKGGYSGQIVDVIFGDDLTTVDFNTGNLRSNAAVNWPATQNQYMRAFYDSINDLWYCSAWDAEIVSISSSPATRWSFVEFSGDRTLVLTDAFKMMKSTGASAQTVTVPPMSDVAWQKGEQVSFYQYGAGALTIVGGSGVTVNTPSTLVMNEQYGTMVIVMDDDDQWFSAGRMAAV